jgi:hypothetical protein
MCNQAKNEKHAPQSLAKMCNQAKQTKSMRLSP